MKGISHAASLYNKYQNTMDLYDKLEINGAWNGYLPEQI